MLTRLRLFIVTMIVLGGCTVPPSAPPAPGVTDAAGPVRLSPPPAALPATGPARLTPPSYQVGEEWRYSDGYAMRVSEVAGGRAKFDRLDAPGQWHVNRGIFREETRSRDYLRTNVFLSDNPDRLYSVPVGTPVVATREYTRNKETLRHNTSWVVERVENVTVPAGSYRAFVIVRRTRSLNSDWTGFERMWYVPEVKNYVRLEYRYGDMAEQSRVLVSYKAT